MANLPGQRRRGDCNTPLGIWSIQQCTGVVLTGKSYNAEVPLSASPEARSICRSRSRPRGLAFTSKPSRQLHHSHQLTYMYRTIQHTARFVYTAGSLLNMTRYGSRVFNGVTQIHLTIGPRIGAEHLKPSLMLSTSVLPIQFQTGISAQPLPPWAPTSSSTAHPRKRSQSVSPHRYFSCQPREWRQSR